jgi:hypothetical protein
MSPPLLRRPAGQRGAAAIEFALVIPVLIGLFCAIVDLASYISAQHRVSRIARDSARVGSVIIEGPAATGDVLREAAEDHAWLSLGASGLQCDGGCVVESAWEADDESGYMMLTMTVVVPFRPLTGFLPSLTTAGVRSTFVMLTQQQ